MVGSSIAYALVTEAIPTDIFIIDIAFELANANVLDLKDASALSTGVNIEIGSYDKLIDGDIVVISCGIAQKEGQTRTDLLNTNSEIIKSVINSIKETGKQVYIILVTNPVDILTHIAIKEANLPVGMVFGSGTLLDTARLRNAIAKDISVNTSNIHAYIMGEHGDTSFPVLSSVEVGGIPLSSMVHISDEYYEQISQKVRFSAYEIIKGKKATYYGIGSAISQICKAIINDENRIFPLSVRLEGQYGFHDVVAGIPVKLSAKGYEFIGEVALNDKEKQMMDNSVKVVIEGINSLNLSQ